MDQGGTERNVYRPQQAAAQLAQMHIHTVFLNREVSRPGLISLFEGSGEPFSYERVGQNLIFIKVLT